MQISTYEHVFPPRRHVASLLLNTKHLGSFMMTLSPLEYSLPLEIWLSFDVISLSPFDINFQEGSSGICCEWVRSLNHKAKQQVECDAGKGQESLSGAGVKECRNKWQAVFSAVKSVAPSCVLRLHRKDSVVPKETNRCDWVHHSENTCHLSSLDK